MHYSPTRQIEEPYHFTGIWTQIREDRVIDMRSVRRSDDPAVDSLSTESFRWAHRPDAVEPFRMLSLLLSSLKGDSCVQGMASSQHIKMLRFSLS